jgi:glucoamylase
MRVPGPIKNNTLGLLAQAIVASAAVYTGQSPLQAQNQGVAPGYPGGKADWLPAKKTGFGTSYTTASKVWFTLEGGRLSEVYYPRIDTPSVRNLDFVVTDGYSFAMRAQDASTSLTRLVSSDQGQREEGNELNSLTYQIVNIDTVNRWRLTTTFVTDPSRATCSSTSNSSR